MKKLLLACLAWVCFGNAFAQLNMTLTDQIDYTQELSSLWGYIDPETGKEYAAVGTETGTSIVDLSDPYNIVEVAFMSDLASTWREVKAWGHYVYAVTEAGGGVQVIDMHDINNVTQTHWAPNIPGLGTLSSIHSITVDEFGYLYLNGSNLNSGGSLIVDARADDGTLTYVGKLPAIYCHDSYARDNKFYSSDIYDGNFKVYDITDRTNPILLATQQTPYSFTHNTWLSDDSKTIFTTDERANAPVGIYDITDLNNIKELDQFRPIYSIGGGAIPHNVHVWNDWVITAYYTEGTLVLDGSRPENVIEVGYFDSFVSQTAGFFGVWGVYPYFPSGLVIASDIEKGLLVYNVNYVRACWLEGKVTNAVTGLPVQGAQVHIESTQANAGTTGIDGVYKTGQAIPGSFKVTFSATGYESKVVTAELQNGVLTILDVQLQPLSVYSFSGQVVKSSDGSPIAGAKILLTNGTNEFTATANGNGTFDFLGVFGGNYILYAGAWGYVTKQVTNIDINGTTAPIIVSLFKGYYDDFNLDYGWTAVSTAQSGQWERGEPVGTQQNGSASNPDNDLPNDLGDQCYVTDNGGGAAGDNDVDGGTVTLTSPVIDLSTYYSPKLKYTPWFYNGGGSGAPNDNFTIKASNGTQTVTLETITQSSSAWKTERVFDLENLLPLSNNMRIIFESSDVTPGHLVEAAVDGFRIEDELPYPAFQVTSNEGCAPFTAQFNDMSDSTSVWSWSFPGGTPSTSTEQSPTVVYTNPGVYDVSLIVTTNTGNTYEIGQPNFITIRELPISNFVYSIIGNVANFTTASTGTLLWDFGDNSTSNLPNPTHTYTVAGTYTVTLTVTNNCGSETSTQTLVVAVVPPTAVFTQSETDGCAPLTVNFTNASLGNPSNYNWSFPGGTPSISNEANPTVVYNIAGTFSVQLTVSNAAGSNSTSGFQIIHIGDLPNAQFAFTNTDLNVVFSNASNGAAFYEWNFGDGTTSNEANPSHTYSTSGEYVVTLTALNDCGTDILTQTVTLEPNGTDQLEESLYSLTASPNPFTEELSVNYQLNGQFETANLLIYNVFGQQVAARPLVSENGTIMLEEALKSSGVYFLHLSLDGKSSKALRVVKL